MNLSVIVPIYNVEEYLREMLGSILSQLQANDELLLIDDGSTDKSGEICDEFATENKHIRVFHIANSGVSRARNFGLYKARGKYVHFADSDDYIEQGMYMRFSEIARKYQPDIIMCGSLQINISKNVHRVVAPCIEKFLNGKKEIASYLDQISSSDMMCLIHYVWNKWYKREFLINEKIAFSPELNLGEDYVFNCTAEKVMKNLYIIPDTYYHYFIRGNSLVSAFQPDPWRSRQLLFDAHKSLYESYSVWDANKNSIMLEEGKMCFVALRSINSKRCKLNRNERKLFLEKMSGSKQMEFIRFYLKNSGKKLHKLWLFLITEFGMTGIRIVLIADYMERCIENR